MTEKRTENATLRMRYVNVSKGNNYTGVFQYFYHCKREELPIRDILDTQRKGHKTEPHYENLTENWCRSCMRERIQSANHRKVDYLFLVTRYFNENNRRRNRKLMVVGFLFRAEDEVWRKLNRSIPSKSKATPFRTKNPETCGFFAGDESKSHFVSAENAYLLKVKNFRWKKWLAGKEEADCIVTHLKDSPNILQKLRKRVGQLKQIDEKGKKKVHCKGC